jgi:hypothetical protein
MRSFIRQGVLAAGLTLASVGLLSSSASAAVPFRPMPSHFPSRVVPNHALVPNHAVVPNRAVVPSHAIVPNRVVTPNRALINSVPPAPPPGFVSAGSAANNLFYTQPFTINPYATLPQVQIPINPNYLVGPGLTVRQAAYNQALLNYGTFANTPFQWYNPFFGSINLTGFPSYPVYPAFNPYASFGFGSFYMNPYAFVTPGGF